MSTEAVRLASNKRKEMDDLETIKSAETKLFKATVPQAGLGKLPEPNSSNQLLAGFLAYEYLTKGTLYGQPFDPSEAEAVPGKESNKVKPRLKFEEAELNNENYRRRYVDVSNLLKADRAQLAGVVNPSQLAHFFQM